MKRKFTQALHVLLGAGIEREKAVQLLEEVVAEALHEPEDIHPNELSTEAWLPIQGLDGYEVSSLGRVRSWRGGFWLNRQRRRTKPLIRKPVPNKRDGHLNLTFNVDGKSFARPVHQLVIEAFLGPRPLGLVVRHLDGDPTNNRVGNLEWGTQAENAADTIRHGRDTRGSRNGNAKLTAEEAKAIQDSSESGVVLAKRYGVAQSTICRIRKGLRYAKD